MAIIDCYGNDDILGHDSPNYVEIAHIAYIYLSNNEQVEIVIRDHDDINNPCFYILTPDRSKELYKVSLFDNSYTEGLNDEDKKILTEFIKVNFSDNRFANKLEYRTIFDTMRWLWCTCNDCEEDIRLKYANINSPNYI